MWSLHLSKLDPLYWRILGDQGLHSRGYIYTNERRSWCSHSITDSESRRSPATYQLPPRVCKIPPPHTASLIFSKECEPWPSFQSFVNLPIFRFQTLQEAFAFDYPQNSVIVSICWVSRQETHGMFNVVERRFKKGVGGGQTKTMR